MKITLSPSDVRTIKLALLTEIHEQCKNGFHYSESSAREVYNHFAELTNSDTITVDCVAIRRTMREGE